MNKEFFERVFSEQGLSAITHGLSTFGQVVDGIEQTKESGRISRAAITPTKVDSNSILRNGGELTKFEGPDHKDGGIPIDENFRVDLKNPVAEVEGGETGATIRGKKFVFSDKIGSKGSSFADQTC